MSKPVKCERCGRENDASFAFCLDCGGTLGAPAPAAAPPPAPACCAGCGAALQPGFRFCGQCGAPLGATPPRGPGPRTPPPPRTPSPDGGERPSITGPHALYPPPLPGAAGAGVRLVTIRADGLPGVVFELHAEETLCGRGEGAVRIPDDPTVSPLHARFTLRGGALAVEDLGSLNGTFLRLRAPRRVCAGDEIRIGRQLLRVEPLPRPPAAPGARAWGAPDRGQALRLAQLLEGGGTGETFPLREGANAIGRDAGDVTFPGDRYVSGRHARLEVDADGATLTDTASSNGTFVRLSAPAALEPGDQLLVGAQLLRVDA